MENDYLIKMVTFHTTLKNVSEGNVFFIISSIARRNCHEYTWDYKESKTESWEDWGKQKKITEIEDGD